MNSGHHRQRHPLGWKREGESSYRLEAGPKSPQTGWLLVELALPPGYLERFFRYMRWIKENEPPIFPNCSFASEPPGIRVGPWPGWRDIPPMPSIELEYPGHSANVEGSYSFLGDEEDSGVLRAFFRVESGPLDGAFLLVGDPLLRPKMISLIANSIHSVRPRPVVLRPELEQVHPRLLFGPEAVTRLRLEANGPKTSLFEVCRNMLRNREHGYEVSLTAKALPGPERLAPEDDVLLSAFIALLLPDEDLIRSAQDSLARFLAAAAGGRHPPMTIDTQSGEALFVGSLSYDWLFTSFCGSQRVEFSKNLRAMAEICRQHLSPLRKDFAQAHYLGCGLGLLAYSFLFWESDPDARSWAAEVRGSFDQVLTMLPQDGFFPHGLNLWIYEWGFIYRWVELWRQCTGEDSWLSHPGLRNASTFRAAATSADGRHGIVSGDSQFLVGGDAWCHFLVANRTGRQPSQLFGNWIAHLPHEGVDHRHVPPRRRVYEYLWWNPEIPSESLPQGLHVFPDGGQLFVRRGSGLFSLKCGPPLGWKRRLEGEPGGYGHSDPAQGAFLLWDGQDFIASGCGPVYRRDSCSHNVLTVNGRGQVGDSCVWSPDFFPDEHLPLRPEYLLEDDLGVRCKLDLTNVWFAHLRVLQWIRSIRVDNFCQIEGEDEVFLGMEAEVAWHFHTWCDVSRLDHGSDRIFVLHARCGDWVLVLREAAEDHVSVASENFVPAYPNDGRRGTHLRWIRHGRKAGFSWKLSRRFVTPAPG